MGFIKLSASGSVKADEVVQINGIPFPYIDTYGNIIDKTNLPYLTTYLPYTQPHDNYIGVSTITVYSESNSWILANQGNFSQYQSRIGFPFLINTNDEHSNIDTGIISGRFRLKNSVLTNYNDDLALGTIIINFKINEEYYKYITFNCGQSWYASEWGFRKENYFTVGVGAYLPAMNTREEPANYKLLTWSKSSNLVTEVFADSIWDFGSGQEVPLAFINWVNENFYPEYHNNVYVLNSKGDITYGEISSVPKIVSLELTTVGNIKTLTLEDINGDTHILEWTSEAQNGYNFVGLSFSKNSKISNVPIGNKITLSLSGNTYLYEVYGVNRPPATTFSVDLYKNSAEANRVDKTAYLTDVGTLNGVMREGSSITDLSITFEMDTLPQFNYVHIPAFNRYYYVTDISTVKYKLWEIELSSDPLMTYKDAILSCKGFVDRNEFDYNNNIIDKKRVIEQGVDIDVIESSTDIFNPSYANNQDSTYWMRYVMNGYKLEASTYTVGEPPQE